VKSRHLPGKAACVSLYGDPPLRCWPACRGSSVCGTARTRPTAARRGIFRGVSRLRFVRASKRHEWVVAMELVETSRLWARRVARIDPEWVEQVAPHLCRSRYGEAHWDEGQGAVYGKETVICGGLPVVRAARALRPGGCQGRAFGVPARGAVRRWLAQALPFPRPPRRDARESRLGRTKTPAARRLWSEEAVLRFSRIGFPMTSTPPPPSTSGWRVTRTR
jgi:hypothetical protein